MSRNVGVKITKQGKDVSSNNPTDYILNTKYSAFKIVKEGRVSFSIGIGDGDKTVLVAHGQDYIPAALCFYELSSGEMWQHWHIPNFIAPTAYAPTGGGQTLGCVTWVDKTNLNMLVDLGGASGSAFKIDAYYYLFANPGR